MRYLAIFVIAGTLVGGLNAQEFTDTFSVNQSNGAPGWTVQSGGWSVSGGQLQTNGAATWSYITKDGFKPVNCVIDIEAFYTPSGVQFAGCTTRFTSSSSTVMCKIQENTTATPDFDRSFIYEQGGSGSTYSDLTTKVATSANVRLIVAGNQAWMQHDFDKDGRYDQTIGPKTLTTVLGAGLIGANAYRTSKIDNWKYFSAALHPQANATPKIGTTFNMDLTTNATASTAWYGALSGGNAGFPVGGTRRIPLTADALLVTSIQLAPLFGLVGTTNASGTATVGLIIPNAPPLIGVTVWCGVITLGSAGIDNISNDVAITFTT